MNTLERERKKPPVSSSCYACGAKENGKGPRVREDGREGGKEEEGGEKGKWKAARASGTLPPHTPQNSILVSFPDLIWTV